MPLYKTMHYHLATFSWHHATTSFSLGLPREVLQVKRWPLVSNTLKTVPKDHSSNQRK